MINWPLQICEIRPCDLDTFFDYENHSYPVSISKFGKLSSCTKSDLLDVLQKINPFCYECPEHDYYFIDGAVMVQANHPKTTVTYGEYCEKEFPPRILNISKTCQEIHVIFDRYLDNGIKQSTRGGCGIGQRGAIKHHTKINNFNQIIFTTQW